MSVEFKQDSVHPTSSAQDEVVEIEHIDPRRTQVFYIVLGATLLLVIAGWFWLFSQEVTGLARSIPAVAQSSFVTNVVTEFSALKEDTSKSVNEEFSGKANDLIDELENRLGAIIIAEEIINIVGERITTDTAPEEGENEASTEPTLIETDNSSPEVLEETQP